MWEHTHECVFARDPFSIQHTIIHIDFKSRHHRLFLGNLSKVCLTLCAISGCVFESSCLSGRPRQLAEG